MLFRLALPVEGPRITNARPRYQIGDMVQMNCTGGRSKPAAHLKWFINGEPAGSTFLKHYETLETGREGLEESTLGLEFRVKPKHFHAGDMKLKVCELGDGERIICIECVYLVGFGAVFGHDCDGLLAIE